MSSHTCTHRHTRVTLSNQRQLTFSVTNPAFYRHQHYERPAAHCRRAVSSLRHHFPSSSVATTTSRAWIVSRWFFFAPCWISLLASEIFCKKIVDNNLETDCRFINCNVVNLIGKKAAVVLSFLRRNLHSCFAWNTPQIMSNPKEAIIAFRRWGTEQATKSIGNDRVEGDC